MLIHVKLCDEFNSIISMRSFTHSTESYYLQCFDSKRRFSEQQAEEWWNNNKERLLKVYSTPKMDNPAPTGSSSTPAPAEESSEATSSS